MVKKKISSSVLQRRKKHLNVTPLISRNRFEVRFNRLKHSIIGKKEKNDKGTPGISRSKANEKRKKTLLVKYKQRNKSNMLVDKRFGEFDESVSAEEKMLKRFTLEKQSHHVKPGFYNIEDEEELTHYGQSLADISNFNEIEFDVSDDGDEDLSDKYGGFLTKMKKDQVSNDGNRRETKLSRKEIMHEIITDSKKQKSEKKKIKQQAFQLTQQLDTDWKEIQSLLVKRSGNDNKSNAKYDDYDKTVNELIFEAKGKPSERLKSIEEIEGEKLVRKKKMEKDRIRRMNFIDDDDDSSKYQSADALIEKVVKKADNRYEVRYKNGKMVVPGEFDCLENSVLDIGPAIEIEKDQNDADFSAEESNNAWNDSGDDNDNDHESICENSEDTTDGSDLENDNEDVFSEDEIQEECSSNIFETDTGGDCEAKEKMVNRKGEIIESLVKTTLVEKANAKGPLCMSDIPENMEELKKLIQTSGQDVTRRLCRICKDNVNKKDELKSFFEILLSYIYEICETTFSLKCINNLTGVIQLLAKYIPTHVTKIIQLNLKLVFERISGSIKCRKYTDSFPSLKEFVIFKVIELIFPTSDLEHVITTPCLYLITNILSKSRISNIKDIISGLFLVNVAYDYVKLSRKYLPEVVTFLSKLLYLAAPNNLPLKKVPASILSLQKHEYNFLVIDEKCDRKPNSIDLSVCLSSSCHIESLENNDMRISCIQNILLLLKMFCKLYYDMETYNEIFRPCLFLLERLPTKNYNMCVRDLLVELMELMKCKALTEKKALMLQKRKPIPLPLLEPQFDELHENTLKKYNGNKTQHEISKLKYKVKKELKGAVREMRKDAQYLAKQQLNEKIEKDNIRKRKVKELESALEKERKEIREMDKRSRFKK